MFSLSEENYLKAIFHLENSYKSGVSTNALGPQALKRPLQGTGKVFVVCGLASIVETWRKMLLCVWMQH